MLVVIEVEKLEVETFNDISKGLEVKVQGKGVHLFPENDYIMRLEEKAKMYDVYSLENNTNDERIFTSRQVTKKGILYRDKYYAFEGIQKYFGQTLNFEFCEDYLVLTLENQVIHAVRQDI